MGELVQIKGRFAPTPFFFVFEKYHQAMSTGGLMLHLYDGRIRGGEDK